MLLNNLSLIVVCSMYALLSFIVIVHRSSVVFVGFLASRSRCHCHHSPSLPRHDGGAFFGVRIRYSTAVGRRAPVLPPYLLPGGSSVTAVFAI
jgi:hypothetical protein